MGTSVSVSQATASDNSPAQCPSAWAEEIAKAIVRSARREDRHPLWTALSARLTGAKQGAVESGDAWPWQSPSEAAYISWESLQDLLASALCECVPEIPERQRLARAAAKAHDELQAKGTGARALKAGRHGLRRCSRCGTLFAARTQRHIWCSSTCRSLAHKERTAAEVMEQVPNTSPAVA
jgi:hypothetical protein